MEGTPQTSQSITLVAEHGVICRNLLTTSTPRLTPTGKISHAKTRVYTQRYRKEWEQMSDFKGWLTSVPCQPTRAYCLYCKKNLHAHRLSLLKHTCTMKHQRSALSYQLDEKRTRKSESDAPEVALMEEVETMDDSQTGLDEDNDDDIEYVVERLETDEDDTIEFKDIKEKFEEQEEKEIIVGDNNQSNEDPTSVIKKIKLLPEQKCREKDPLAQAMAHVHSEYLEEEIGDQENVQMEMVVESTNDISGLSEPVDNSVEKISKSHENEKTVIKTTKNGQVLQQEDNKNLVVTSSLLNTAYQTNISTSTAPTQNTINFVPIAPNIKTQKTITLMCGNKTFTLTGGTFQPGTQYVLTKLKGKPTALMLTDQKKAIAVNEPNNKCKMESIETVNQSPAIPSTSQQPTAAATVNQQSTSTKVSSKKNTWTKQQVKQTVSRKLRISTYVVDTVKGVPIGGLQVSLYKLMDGKWTFLNEKDAVMLSAYIELKAYMDLAPISAFRLILATFASIICHYLILNDNNEMMASVASVKWNALCGFFSELCCSGRFLAICIRSNTNAEGYCNDLVEKVNGTIGRYKIHFDVDKYFTLKRIDTMFPFVEIVFDVKNPNVHYHIPLLLSPFGYTTYRGHNT